MADNVMLTSEEREAFFAAREKFIEENSRKEFRESMKVLRESEASIPEARRAFMVANPA